MKQLSQQLVVILTPRTRFRLFYQDFVTRKQVFNFISLQIFKICIEKRYFHRLVTQVEDLDIYIPKSFINKTAEKIERKERVQNMVVS